MYSILIMNFLVPVLDYQKGIFQFKPEKAAVKGKSYSVSSFYATNTTKPISDVVGIKVPSFEAYDELPKFAEFSKILLDNPDKARLLQKITASKLCGCDGN